MPSISLENFKGALEDAARPNRFMVSFSGDAPSKVSLEREDVTYFVKAIPLPGRTIGQIDLWWFGRKANVGGDLVFDDVEIRFVNDYNFTARHGLEGWMDLVATNGASNERGYHLNYKGEVRVEQLGRVGEVLSTYILEGAYPKSMGNIELSHETINAVEEYSVTFAIDGWRRE
jgi:hypothetical protein